MPNIIYDFRRRRVLVENVTFSEAKTRLSGLLKWMQEQAGIKAVIDKLKGEVDAASLVKDCDPNTPPEAATPEEIAAIGILLMEKCQAGDEIFQLALTWGITPSYSTTKLQAYTDEAMHRYVEPALDFIEQHLEAPQEEDVANIVPPVIAESLQRFRENHPFKSKTAFIMMRFQDSPAHQKIDMAIRSALAAHGIDAVRADDKQYHEDLFPNVLTYIHGCGFGVAVFERLVNDEFNPNVSLEVGYLFAQKKPVCLLKDQTIKTLHTDLVGKLYRPFDPQEPIKTIPPVLGKWLNDQGLAGDGFAGGRTTMTMPTAGITVDVGPVE